MYSSKNAFKEMTFPVSGIFSEKYTILQDKECRVISHQFIQVYRYKNEVFCTLVVSFFQKSGTWPQGHSP